MKRLLSIIISDIFLISLVLYLGSMFTEQFMPGLISRAFNVTYLLLACIVSGALSICLPVPSEAVSSKKSPLVIILSALISIGIGSTIWHLLLVSPFARIFGIAGSFIVFFAFFAMMSDNNSK